LNKTESAEKIESLKKRAEQLLHVRRKSPEFKKWRRDTEIAIQHIFGEDTRHSDDFLNIRYTKGFYTTSTAESEFQAVYRKGIEHAIAILDSLLDEIREYWSEEPERNTPNANAIDKVKLLISRFHQVARQLRSRHSSRNTIEIEDEYDVQDLFHSLLRIFFEDVRPEECAPSYAGSASRVDFLLKEEKIIIEIKKTRKSLGAKEIGEQLIIDSERYQAHPDCGTLICFVYDPEGRVANPKGIERDLTKKANGIQIIVCITPNS
jgi:hypothetical protein